MAIYTFHVTIVGLDNLWRKINVKGEQTLNDLHIGIQRAFDFDADHMYAFYLSGKAWDKATEYGIPEGYGWGRPKRISQKDKDAVFLHIASEVMDRPKMTDVQMIRTVVRANSGRGEYPDDETLRRIFPKMAAEPIERLRWYYLIFAVDWIDAEIELNRNVFEVKLQDMPLKVGQSMLYLFDFGDEWHFKVLLWDIDTETKIDKRQKYPKTIAQFGEAPEQYPDYEGDDWDEEEFDFDESDFGDEDDVAEDEDLEALMYGIDDIDDEEISEAQADAILANRPAANDDLPEGIPPDLPKSLYRWYFQPKRTVVEPSKAEKDLTSKVIDAFLATEFTPRFSQKIKSVSSKWLKRFCYIQVVLHDGKEKKLLRLEHAGEGRFHLSGLDAKGNWREDYEYLPLKYCFAYLLEESRYHP